MNVKGKRIAVIGAGKSGISAAVLLCRAGASVFLFDGNEKLDKEGVAAKIDGRLEEGLKGLVSISTKEPEPEYDALVLSPGVPTDTALVESFKKKDIPVWGEVELGYLFGKGRIIAITGTNGKTTTTTLVGEIVKKWYESEKRRGRVYVAGNIGDPYTDIARDTTEDDTCVLEISSFQLETTDAFHPDVSAILNITPDHLNRHHTMENYAACKGRVALRQNEKEYCIMNLEDEYLPGMAEKMVCRPLFFSYKREVPDGIYHKDGTIYLKGERLMDVSEMKLPGAHNVENVMAAIAMSYVFGVPLDIIIDTVKNFRSVEHRIEYTATVSGVDYYNDSKGTNPDAAIKGIQAMVKPTVLIGGGYDKMSTYDEWIESFDGKVKALILLGQTAGKIAECARAHGFEDIYFVNDMQEAVKKAAELAGEGDAVLLSPACASWGMFKNFEERGKIFKEAVRGLMS